MIKRSTLARHGRNFARHSSLIAATGLLVVGLARCSDPAAPDRVFSGTPIILGAGLAHSEVTIDNAGDIKTFAIVMNDAALASMPATAMSSFIVPLPDGIAAAPLNHVTLDWNPNGHPPVGIYDKPHFDFHYYVISTQERDAIVPTDPLFATKVSKQPTADLIAPNYVGDPNGVPRMGVHWTDKTAPERNGQAFTQSAIYGFYNGSMVFVEPMFTYSYLSSKPNSTMSIPQPARYEKPGRYPTTFSIHYDAATGTHRLELAGFVTH